jgi:hypothetical protein
MMIMMIGRKKVETILMRARPMILRCKKVKKKNTVRRTQR